MLWQSPKKNQTRIYMYIKYDIPDIKRQHTVLANGSNQTVESRLPAKREKILQVKLEDEHKTEQFGTRSLFTG